MPPEPRHESLIKAIFRWWSHVYDQPIFQWTIFSRVHRRLLEAADGLEPKHVLDVGCGTGELLLSIAHRWPRAELSGVDLSPDMLAKACRKNYGHPVHFAEGSVYELPFERDAFDLVLNSISSHFYVEGERAFSEIARVTSPGCTLLQASLTSGVLARLPKLANRSVAVPGAVYRGTGEQRRLIEGAGFEVVESYAILPGVRLYHCVKR
jgi:ubiquinone/menaquinone biosynthesis C-methylase UbiE